ncbi:MAG: winged helix-turn-helix transcriptional regulator [Nitrospiraceae bacterium]|nr:winged helix-turn-helix transcriptional regulator [Nitrospiraceae bacterium]
MNVHDMNDREQPNHDTYRSLLLLDEISKGEPLSQRDLSKRLNIALGLVNSYVKNLVSKGYITVKSVPAKRFAYFVTPKGFAEKTRLTYHHLQNFTNLYRGARSNLKTLFREMDESGIKRVVFAGTGEVAEIAYITLQETAMKLVGVVDTEVSEKKFFGQKVKPLSAIEGMKYDCVIVTRYLEREKVYDELLRNGVDEKGIRVYF